MKLLFVITDLSIEAGGVTSAVCGLSEALAARGHAITIVGLDLGGTPARPVGTQIHVFAPDSKSKLAPSRSLNAWLSQNVAQFDVVHIHGVWQHPGHYAARWAYKHHVPYLVAPHGMLDNAALRLRRMWVKRLAWLLWDGQMCRRAAAIHCLNQAEYRVSPWIHKLRHVVLGNGIAGAVLADMPRRGGFRQAHPEWFGAATEDSGTAAADATERPTVAGGTGDCHAAAGGGYSRPMALFLSRIHPKKGLDRLFPVWPFVLQKQPHALLVVAGTGPADYVQSLQNQCRALQIDNSVVWAGQLVGRAKYEALADADLFVLPSHQEGFSMAITEAMAAGCPVVITRPCNFDEVAGAGAGLIAEDMPGFANAVAKVLADKTGRAVMGNNGRRLVQENYTWETVAEKAEGIYQSLG